jgi:O-antigen ligase
VISGASSSLYFYSITNRGSPVGIFANENHSAVFSAAALIVVGFLGLSSRKWREPIWLRLGYAPVFITILVALLVSGSRAGIAMGLIALVVIAVIAVLSLGGSKDRQRRGHRKVGRLSKARDWIVSHPGALLLVAAAIVTGLLTAFISLGRSAGFEDVFNQNAFADLRWDLLPILQQMAASHWGLGSGFGSFEEVYHLYEPTELLLPFYVNQAHNDWLQIVIEGGVPAIAIVLALLLWIASSLRALFVQSDARRGQILMYGAVIAVIAGSSLVDYPLRSPSFQAISVWILLSLALAGRDEDKPAVGHG